MSEYPNLNESQIDTTTQFFTKLSNLNNGNVTIQKIIDVCSESSNQSKPHAYLPWLDSLQTRNNLELTSEIDETTYNEYKTTTPEIHSLFSEIDTENTGTITFEKLKTYYLDSEQNRLDSEYIPYYPSQSFIELIKKEKNLTNESIITLNEMLSYENEYNITRYWPL
jgi:hypothetical protein